MQMQIRRLKLSGVFIWLSALALFSATSQLLGIHAVYAGSSCDQCVALQAEIEKHSAEHAEASRELKMTQAEISKLPDGPSAKRSKMTSSLIIFYARLETAKNLELTAKKNYDSKCRACSKNLKNVTHSQ